jgi:hypothetical protein
MNEKFSAGLLFAVALSAPTGLHAEPRAVIELFTSQGCSSCPPADKLIGELARDESIIALSLPVDYWDYLGWKDTLADARHSARQRSYAKARGDREVYTPQIVINGARHVLGSDKSAIETSIAALRRDNSTPAVPVKVSVDGDRVEVAINPARSGERSGEVWLCAMARRVPVTVARGENKGRTITYHNVVRRWTKLGTWTGGTQTWSVPKKDVAGDGDAAVVLVQSGSTESPGPILGAASVSLN